MRLHLGTRPSPGALSTLGLLICWGLSACSGQPFSSSGAAGNAGSVATAGSGGTSGGSGGNGVGGNGGVAGNAGAAGSNGGMGAGGMPLMCDQSGQGDCGQCAGEKCCPQLLACAMNNGCACVAYCIGQGDLASEQDCFDVCGLQMGPIGYGILKQCLEMQCPDPDECGP